MSDAKIMKRQTRQNIRHLRDILTGMDIMAGSKASVNGLIAYAFTQKLINLIYHGELSPEEIKKFISDAKLQEIN